MTAMGKIATVSGITRGYLHDQVADRLRDLIAGGQLEPGARLNEAALAARFGISRTPLREAIKILATEGLLELLPNRGARVVALSSDEVDQMIEVIAGLEATAGELACRRISDDAVGEIARMTEAMEAAHAAGDDASYFAYNRRIHEEIVRAASNRILEDLYAGLSGRVQALRYRARKSEAQWARALDEHRRIVACLRARDADGLRELMREHVRSKRDVLAAAYGG